MGKIIKKLPCFDLDKRIGREGFIHWTTIKDTADNVARAAVDFRRHSIPASPRLLIDASQIVKSLEAGRYFYVYVNRTSSKPANAPSESLKQELKRDYGIEEIFYFP